ncbi:MAG: hypothetical protein RR049_03860 [Angelakisella sp.]
MLTIKALPDGAESALSCLGTLCPLEGVPSEGVSLSKKIEVDGIGSYKKKLYTPLYKTGAMQSLSVGDPIRRFDATHCFGVLCSGVSVRPLGYVTRNCGAHCFCLPVYDPKDIPSAFYRINGYMVTSDGFVAVAGRRTLLWALLGLGAGIIFVLSYLTFEYGAEGAAEVLAQFWQSLF